MPQGEFPSCSESHADVEFEQVPTWSADVAPLIYARCSGCHMDSETAPFTFMTYERAAQLADVLAEAVVARSMPPAGPTSCGECQSFTNSPWLTPVEIATLRAWAEGGAPAGDMSLAPPLPSAPAPLDRVDRSVTVSQPYTPTAEEGVEDDYRCFVVDPELDDTQYLSGFQVQAGNPELVHHVILYGLYSDEHKQLAADLEAADDRFGFGCFGTSGIDEAPMLAAWAPGTPPIVYPEGSGVRLTPDMQLIMQVHYHIEDGSGSDQSSMDLRLEPAVDNEAVLFPAGNYGFEIKPGQAEITDSEHDFDFIGPVGPVQVHAVAPHMHTRGLSMQVEVGTGDDYQCLLDMQNWDFDWQGMYMYEEPVSVRAGAQARITCSWDTRGAESSIWWGDGTGDEMCLALFYVTGLPQKRLDDWYGAPG